MHGIRAEVRECDHKAVVENNTMTELIHEEQKLVSLCPMCGLEGIQTQVEKLTKAGVLMLMAADSTI